MNRIHKAILVIIVLSAVGIALVPWKTIVQQKLVEALQEKGFEEVRLTVKDLGFSSVTLESISLGGAMPIALNSLEVNYSLAQLWQGRLDDITLSGVSFTWGEITATSSETTFKTTPDTKGEWKGTWSSNAIAVSGVPVSMPSTQASGTWALAPEYIDIAGKWGSADKSYNAQFGTRYLLANPQASEFKLSSFAMPWGGGSIALRDTTIPFAKKAYTLGVIVKAISVDALLQPLTGNRATATGTVSGTLPISVNVDGSFMPKSGALKSEKPGKIMMQPDAIPGDNAQIDMLREVMQDFHYSNLALSLSNDANNKLSVGLMLEGNNPAKYDGRPVKLNVHLSGDVLDLVRQNLAVSDPQKLLKAQ